ncbi:hypothetical protein [Paraburkholderia sp. ZP32-5]|uniref:hypothetical protein n=1 Tax=Paraburkholderia sp. ZP32-5 TaxID=2883245 RepID=UPI001F442A6B|nr:hypothetical protein [Paraburkholderia sp. ZP32-5]
MSPVGVHTPASAQQTAATTHVERARAENAQPQKRAHFAALYKGKTTFAHSRAQRLATRKAQAHRLAQKLGARKPGIAKTARFTHTAKTVSRAGREAGKASTSGKGEHRKVSREQERRGRNQQKEQQDRQQGQQGQQKKQQREEQSRESRKRHDGAMIGVQASNERKLPPWLADAAALPAGPERDSAIADACCEALLSLCRQLGAPSSPANSAGLYQHLRQMHDVRSVFGALPASGFGAVRQRLIDSAARRAGAATSALAAGTQASPAEAADVASRERLRSFNLLAPLMMLSSERPVTALADTRAAAIIGSLEARQDTPTETGAAS